MVVAPSGGPVAGTAARRRVASGSGVDLLDLEYHDAAVGPLPELDGDVLRHERAADAHTVLLPVDRVALQVLHPVESPPDPLVAPVAVDVHPHGHAVELVAHQISLLRQRWWRWWRFRHAETLAKEVDLKGPHRR
uniref:Uncharacterized protein n=1 Tax=Arundo donax TaxID=35708 RepID=A0A0A9GVR7_ARUDO